MNSSCQNEKCRKISCMDNRKNDTRPRSIKPSTLLSGLGNVFRDPSPQVVASYRMQSTPSNSVDVFLSHVWASNATLRYSGLLWYRNAITASCLSILTVLLVSAILAESYDGRAWVRFESRTLLTTHSILSLFGTALLIILLFSIHFILKLLRFREPNFFMDRCCIEQMDHELKMSEIRQIPQIIEKSRSMLILLSENYFKRLWCCYEIAIYVGLQRERQPIFLHLRLVAITLLILLSDLIYIVLIRSNLRTYAEPHSGEAKRALTFYLLTVLYSLLLSGLCLGFAVIWSRENRRHRQIISEFTLPNAECSDPDDRQTIQAGIAERFGSIERFDHFVRTEILDLVTQASSPRLQFTLVAGLPQLFALLGYINILSQRIGLYCMFALDAVFVPKDDSFCVVLDRERWANAIVILSQFVRYICFYPVIFRLLILGCDWVDTRFSHSKFSMHSIFCGMFAIELGYIIFSNWKFHEKDSIVIQGVEAGLLLCTFGFFEIRERFHRQRASQFPKQ